MSAKAKGTRVRYWHDDGMGGCWTYGVVTGGGAKRTRILWESGIEQWLSNYFFGLVEVVENKETAPTSKQ